MARITTNPDSERMRNAADRNSPVMPRAATLADLVKRRETLKLKEPRWRIHTHDIYHGKADDLIAAGLVRPEQLPGTEGMPSKAATFYDGQLMARHQRAKHDEKYMNIVCTGSRFTVYVGVTAEVRTQRERMQERDREASHERLVAQQAQKQSQTAEVASARLKKCIAEGTLLVMPTSPVKYRQQLVEKWNSAAQFFRAQVVPSEGDGVDMSSIGVHGFSLDESDVSEFDDLINEIEKLLSNAAVRFNAWRQKEIVSHCRTALAHGDARFQNILTHIQQSTVELPMLDGGQIQSDSADENTNDGAPHDHHHA